MRPNFAGLREDFLSADDTRPTLPDLDALKMAKATQGVSSDRLDKWIATAISELSDKETRRHSSRERRA
jgi:hypothetical protein